MDLPRLQALLVGRAVWDRWVVVTPPADPGGRSVITLHGPLALLHSYGVQVLLASNEDWPGQAIVGVDAEGDYHPLVGADGKPRV
jgi:hypothetical protein